MSYQVIVKDETSVDVKVDANVTVELYREALGALEVYALVIDGEHHPIHGCSPLAPGPFRGAAEQAVKTAIDRGEI